MKSVAELMNVSGRKALVTGGAGHLGFACAEVLVELGATVAVVDRDLEKCQAQVAQLQAQRAGSALAMPCDLKDEASTRQTVREAIAALGGLDILVHSAAYVGTTKTAGWAVPFAEQTVAAWDEAMRVNVTAPFIMLQEAQGALQVSGHGSVILVGSTYGMVGPDMRLYEGTSMANPAGYNASKGGLLQLTRYFASLFAPAIRVNAVSPGGVWRNQPEVFHERYRSRTPLQRMAVEEDLKGAFAYLASDLSRYVTGQNLVVDGGFTAW